MNAVKLHKEQSVNLRPNPKECVKPPVVPSRKLAFG